MPPSLPELLASTPLSGANASYVEALYEQYLRDPDSIAASWRSYFDTLPPSAGPEQAHGPVIAGVAARTQASERSAVAAPPATALSEKQAAVSRLMQIYSNRGHLVAHIDPLGLLQRPRPRVLDLDYAGLSEADLDTEFYTASRNDWIPRRASLREIIARLERVYCGHIGAEFAHVSNTDERLWLQDEFQLGRMQHRFSAEERRNLLYQLTAAEGLERYLHTKYVGQKRFSLEGADALIASLNEFIQAGGQVGIEEFVLGMAHRGRLNVLVNVLGKSPAATVLGVRGQARRHSYPGIRRRQVSQGLLRRRAYAGRQRARRAGLQPVASGDRRSGGRRLGARAPGAAQRCPGRPRGAGADARRRGVRRPGRRDGDAAAVAGARLPYRRHGAHHHQQPDRLHHLRSARRALDHVLQRRCEDRRGADLSRQRRRSGGRAVRDAPGAALSAALPQGRRDRPGVLPAARAQRGRRAGGDPAGDVPRSSASTRRCASCTPTGWWPTA